MSQALVRMENPLRQHLLSELRDVLSELHELHMTSYSQSNPSRALALRALERRKARLEAQITATATLTVSS